jgi:hypothetical protein
MVSLRGDGCSYSLPVPRAIDENAYRFLAAGAGWVDTWTRAAKDAVARLEAARAVDDNDGGLIAANEALMAVDRLYGWAVAMAKVCDEAYRSKVEAFRLAHPDLRQARNMHEHLPGYLAPERDKQANHRLSGAVTYGFTSDGSFRIQLLTGFDDNPVDVELSQAIIDSFALAWETTKAVDRAVRAMLVEPGEDLPDIEYLHLIEDVDGGFRLDLMPPDGYQP